MKQINKYVRDGVSPFDERFKKIKDHQAKDRITKRLIRLSNGNAGDFRKLDEQLFELRIDVGKGWRVYYTEQNNEIVLLMLVGDKSQQAKDIKTVRSWLNENT